jgi:P27 family predicted phage terminase small subunit
MRGRKPKPTALKVLRGNPGKRAINHAEPIHPALDPADCPLTDPIAREEWARIAPRLILQGQVLTVDRSVLMGYCLKYAQWQALEAEARTHPFIVKAPTGYPIPNPALGMANRAFGWMLKAAAELGITPSSRSRIVAMPGADAPPQSKWQGLM